MKGRLLIVLIANTGALIRYLPDLLLCVLWLDNLSFCPLETIFHAFLAILGQQGQVMFLDDCRG